MSLDEVFQLWSAFVLYAEQHLHILAPAVGGAIVIGLLVLVLLRDRNAPEKARVIVLEERKMTKEERAAYVKRTVADAIGNALEDAVDAGKLTPDEVLPYYQVLGHRCGFKDLLPGGGARSLMLKKQIKQRLINGDRRPVNIPDGKVKHPEPKNRLEAVFLRNAS